jgi:hypothetical protein
VKLEEQGGRQPRDVRGFGKNAALEGYFALGVSRDLTVRCGLTFQILPKLSEDQLDPALAFDLQSYLASFLAVMLLTGKPFLYPTVIDHLVNHVCSKASSDGCGERGLSVLGRVCERYMYRSDHWSQDARECIFIWLLE